MPVEPWLKAGRPPGAGVYRFSNFELDEPAAELRRDGVRIPLAPQSLTLLAYLIRNRSRALGRDELLAAAWEGTVVGEGSLRVAIHEIRQALGDTGAEQHFVQTVRARGYRFVASVSDAGSHVGAELLSLPALCGRDRELLQLRAAMSAALERGRACLLIGSPGVGKSRLARELLQLARAQGFATAEGHADPDDSTAPFGVFRQLLAAIRDQTDNALLRRCEEIAPTALRALASNEGSSSFSPDHTPEQLRVRLFGELTQLFLSLAEARPLVLLLDDLQWADEASLAFFAHSARAFSRGRILLLATCRKLPTRENRPLARAIEAALREPSNTRMELDNLTVETIAEILSVAGREVDRSQAAQIHALTQGNPLFSLEVAELLREADDVTFLAQLREAGVELRTVIRRRLRALPHECADTVLKASVLGPDFTVAELAAVLSVAPNSALRAVDTCLELGILLEQAGTLRFSHPLVRDAAYEELSQSERCELHRRLAEWLDKRGEDASTAGLSQLAHHYYRGAASGAADKAVYYARRCAERAVEATAYASAVAYYEHALQCADLLPDFGAHARLELEIERARALRMDGPASSVNALLLQLAERAFTQSDAVLFARAVLTYSGQMQVGFSFTRFAATIDVEEISLIERALQAIGGRASETRVLLLCSLSSALLYSTERARRESACEEAVRLARSLGIPWLLARALLIRAYACAAPDSLERRLESLDELIDVVQEHGLRELELEARMSRAVCRLELCEVESARRDELRAIALAGALHSPRLHARTELLSLLHAFAAGDLETTERLARNAIDQDPNDLLARALFVARTAAINMMRTNDSLSARTIMQSLVATYPDTMGFRCSLASVLADRAEYDAAREQFDWVARNDFAMLPQDINWPGEMSYLADAVVVMDDLERAQLLYKQLRPFADRWILYAGEAVPGGPMAHWLAELAITRRDAELAERWLATARAACVRMQASLFLQYNALAEARLLLICHPEQARARARAHELLEGVKGFATPRGLVALSELADVVPKRSAVASASRGSTLSAR